MKKSGVFTLRLAVRDNNSKRLGTAGDFVDIPDAKSNKLFISGLITSEISSDGRPKALVARPVNAAFAPVFSMTSPSIRQFRLGSILPYSFFVNNARPEPGSGKVKLTKELRLYRNGELIDTEDEKPIETEGRQISQRFEVLGVKNLTAPLLVGEYALQLLIRDKVANRVSSQSIDFEIVD